MTSARLIVGDVRHHPSRRRRVGVLSIVFLATLAAPAVAQPDRPGDPYGRIAIHTAPSAYWGYTYSPYDGYLHGAADVIRAQADFLVAKEETAYLRERTRRAQLETRRAELEQVSWERDWRADEIIRERERRKRVIINRHLDPPLNEIFSGTALNTLFDELAKHAPLSPDTSTPVDAEWLAYINKTVDGRGNIGILRGEQLWWPQLLLLAEFSDTRKAINQLFATAREQVLSPSASREDRADTLRQLRLEIETCRQHLRRGLNSDDPDWSDHYIDAKRFLQALSALVVVLDRPDAAFFLKPLEGKNVAELVAFMKNKGVRFAEANVDGQRAYVALHHALADELTRLQGGSPSPDR